MTLAEQLRQFKIIRDLEILANKLLPYFTLSFYTKEEVDAIIDAIPPGGSFSGTMDDITDGATYVKTHNDYTDAEQSKLAGIEAGADVTDNANVLSALGFTPENVSNKQTNLTASATKYPTVNAVNTGLALITSHLPQFIWSADNPYTWGVSDTQYISIVVTGVLVIDGSSVGAINCSIQLQHGGFGILTSITAGFRNSDSGGDRIPFTLTCIVEGSGWEGNDFSVVETTYGSTIEEVNWNFIYGI